MPTVSVYFRENVYWKIARYASLWDVSIQKAIQLIVEKGLEVLEKEGERWK
ncbi:MAG: hypothetical protein QXH51_06835 [Candidatus Bathyarchaeia archaeon]